MELTSLDLQDTRLLDVVLNVTVYPLSSCNSMSWTVRTTKWLSWRRKFLNFRKRFVNSGLPLITPRSVESSKSRF